MLGYILLVIVVVIIGYKVISPKPRPSAKSIGQAINVKPLLVEKMICDMGVERGNLFVNTLTASNNISIGVYTFIIFQVLKNAHPQNIQCWKEKLLAHGYEVNLGLDVAETVFIFLRDAEADIEDIAKFVKIFNEPCGILHP